MTADGLPPPHAAAPLTERPQWLALQRHCAQIGGRHLRDLFSDEPARGVHFNAAAAGLYLDYSKQRITSETLRLLQELALACGLPKRIEAMFSGDRINRTENRAVLHVALRAPADAQIMLDGKNVVPAVHAVLDRMASFAARVRDGRWTGHSGKRIRHIVNIGIGGSNLGPVIAIFSAPRRSLCCLTHTISSVSRLTCSNWRWRATASTSRSTVCAWTTPQDRSTGASLAPTVSIRSTS